MATWMRVPTWLKIVGGSVAAIAIVIGLEAATRPQPGSQDSANADYEKLPEALPAIVQPTIHSADTAGIADDEIVIGVVAGGRPRAYRRAVFERISHHVVNDLVGGTPLTVTHCDRTRCTRVFAGDDIRPLSMTAAGYNEGLLLRSQGQIYRQDTGRPLDNPDGPPLPYRTMPFEITTWSKWRAAHPETDVYLSPFGALLNR